jgi:hypothetical protein
VAWLLSEHHLSAAQLERASHRIRAGHRLAPREDLLVRARAGLEDATPGRSRRMDEAADPPGGRLPRWTLVVLGVISLLFTPLPGWVAWWSWRHTAPRAAHQVLQLLLPLTVVGMLAWSLALGAAWGRRWGLF